MTTTVTLEPMDIVFDPNVIEDLRDRLRRTRRTGATDGDWSRGVTSSWLDEVLRDWAAFDVAALQHQLAQLTHLRAGIDGRSVHVVVAEGHGPAPLPLLLANGWPSTFCEYLDVLPLLTDPGAHGGDPADAFSVVVPALPGFGFSAPPPPAGLRAAHVAELWNRLMTQGLGHPRYVAHGSDLGAGVVAQLARAHASSVAAIHLASPGLTLPPPPWTSAEQTYADDLTAWSAEEGGYSHQHSTKPATVGTALNDSPAGLAAWIGEKISTWSSQTVAGQPAFPRDLLLATLTIYWATQSIASSMLPYWAFRHDPRAALTPDVQPSVPTAVSLFGGERVPFPRLPRVVAERFFDVSVWQEHDRGGHFPAAAEPQLLAATLREVFRPARAGR
jgi:pimeloyl-ACP methyl ester carboxylesterase